MPLKRIGVFTSGGDAPGMNAAIRAVVRTAWAAGIEVWGIRRGYQGLIEGELDVLGPRNVANIVQRGGTVLRTARSEAFRTPEGRALAAEALRRAGIEALVAIGGDGTFHGAVALSEEHGIRVVGVPGTIDNDLWGTDSTIGYDTAVNTALDAIDRIRDTAASHERLFFVEVMGRHAGFIALDVGIAGGAEDILVPEVDRPIEEVVKVIRASIERGKSSSIIVVAEGFDGGAMSVMAQVQALTGFEARTSILGHIQRGGAPTASDRILASRLGHAAVDALVGGGSGLMAGIRDGEVVFVPLRETWEKGKKVDDSLYRMARTLSV